MMSRSFNRVASLSCLLLLAATSSAKKKDCCSNNGGTTDLCCVNNGQCIVEQLDDGDGVAEYCICESEQWGGADCSVEVEVEECEDSDTTCLNGSKCHLEGSGDSAVFTCDCTAIKGDSQYAGPQCEYIATKECSKKAKRHFCANGGQCMLEQNANIEEDEPHKGCFCPQGFSGDHCEIATLTILVEEPNAKSLNPAAEVEAVVEEEEASASAASEGEASSLAAEVTEVAETEASNVVLIACIAGVVAIAVGLVARRQFRYTGLAATTSAVDALDDLDLNAEGSDNMMDMAPYVDEEGEPRGTEGQII